MEEPSVGRGNRLLRILATALVTAGLVILADAGLTLLWQEPASAAYAWFGQRGADADLEELEAEYARQNGADADLDQRDREGLAKRMRTQIMAGQGIGRVKIPEIGLNVVMVQGTDTSSLRKGPGHYPETRLPGEGATVGIAGHRTTYSAPFRKINELDRGGRVIVEMPYGRYTYSVEKTRIVEPSQVGVVRNIGRERVVLTACHPLYSAEKRIVVFARLVEEKPPVERNPATNGSARAQLAAPAESSDQRDAQ